jgi:hypothetical protein
MTRPPGSFSSPVEAERGGVVGCGRLLGRADGAELLCEEAALGARRRRSRGRGARGDEGENELVGWGSGGCGGGSKQCFAG